MTTRSRYSGSSTEVPWDDAGPIEGFGNQYHRLLGVLFDHSALVLTTIGGSGDAVTASLDPELDAGGLKDGMKFGITWAAANTGGVTLAINGGLALPVLDAEGAALEAGRLANGLRSLIEHVGGAFRVLTPLAGGLTVPKYYQAFTASGTWTKPSGLADDAMVVVEAWGGGASGGRQVAGGTPGGGGGGYARKVFRAADLPASVAVAIGAGGAARTTNGQGNAGGTTTFGALLAAFGGSTFNGGGEFADRNLHVHGGGDGGRRYTTGSGEDTQTHVLPPGHALYGGAGGGEGNGAVNPGGQSLHGGNGGDGGRNGVPPTAGAAPGGGGGAAYSTQTSGAGARGEVRIWIP